MGDASSITIEQLDGDQQKVVLHGPALPFQGAAWKSKQSVVTTWYPGNPQEATQQVLGAQEMPSSWEGMWRRTQMGHTPSRIYSGPNDGTGSVINHPSTLRDVLDQIFFQGSRLKVTWTVIAADPTQPSASITRVGRATEWEFPHDRVHDIAWKITFEWSGRGKSLQKVVSTRDDDSASANAALLAAMDADVATTLGLGLDLSVTANRIAPPSNFNLGQLASIANYPNALCAEFSRNIRLVSGKIKQIANVINTVKNLPFSMSNTLLGSVRNTKSVCATFIDACSATPIEMMNTQTNLRLLASTGNIMGAKVEVARAIARSATNYEATLIIPTNPSPNGIASQKKAGNNLGPQNKMLAVCVVKNGDTLITLSQRYYKSPDHGLDIAKANHLPWHIVVLTPGTVLIIPVVGNGTL